MTRKIVIQDFELPSHNHKTCVNDALRRAENLCIKRGEKFTPLRHTILELLWSSHQPVKAYDLLAQLALTHSRPAPTTVYRTLEFLEELGVVHKLESINSYIGCGAPERPHQGQFLICASCGVVAELDDDVVSSRIETNAKRVGFKVGNETIEVSGICRACQ